MAGNSPFSHETNLDVQAASIASCPGLKLTTYPTFNHKLSMYLLIWHGVSYQRRRTTTYHMAKKALEILLHHDAMTHRHSIMHFGGHFTLITSNKQIDRQTATIMFKWQHMLTQQLIFLRYAQLHILGQSLLYSTQNQQKNN